jgi:hypothetical protein
VEIRGVRTAFLLEERLQRKERELTEAQKKEKAKKPWMYSYPSYDRVPTGSLRLKITEPGWRTNNDGWTDGKRKLLEVRLNDFLAAMRIEVEQSLYWKNRREQEAIEQKEQARLDEELRKRRLAEQRRLWALLSESISWEYGRRIREYVSAIKERASQMSVGSQEDEELTDWIQWALQQADALDPLAIGAHCRLGEKRGGSSQDGSLSGAINIAWGRLIRRSRYLERRADAQREVWEEF